MRRQLRLRAAAALCLLGLVTAACDSGAPTDPGGPRSQPTSGSAYSAGTSGGSFSIPIPSDNGRDWGRVNWTPTSIVVAPGSKVRVRVIGTVSLSANPVYMMKACIYEMPEGYCPPKFSGKSVGPGGILDHDYRALKVSVRVNSGAGVEYVPLVYSPDGMSAEAVYTTVGGSFEVYRSGVIAGYGDIDGSVGAYLMSGDQKLVVEPADGGGDTCTVSAFGAAGYDVASSDDDCQDDSEEDKPKLVLECNGVRSSVTVERGGRVDCTAKTEPASTSPPQVTEWTFEGGGSTIEGPAGASAWGGTMVVGGSITVEATVDGELQEDQVSVTVRSRGWSDILPSLQTVKCSSASSADCPLRSPLVYEMDTGQTILRPERISVPAEMIGGGPNRGWWYATGSTSPIRFKEWVMYLNEELFDPRSDFYRRRSSCQPASMQQWIVDHENVHVAETRSQVAAGRMNPVLEELVAYGSKAFEKKYEKAVGDVIRRLKNLGDPRHRRTYPTPPCDLRLRSNPR